MKGKKYIELFPGMMVQQHPLMTKTIEKKLLKTNIDDYEDDPMELEVITAYYTPFARARWIIVSGEKMENGDYILFGYCHIHVWEWGSVYLSDIQELINNGIYVERDLFCKGKKVKDLLY